MNILHNFFLIICMNAESLTMNSSAILNLGPGFTKHIYLHLGLVSYYTKSFCYVFTNSVRDSYQERDSR